MINTVRLNSATAQVAWQAAADCQRRNRANYRLYTKFQRELAETTVSMVGIAYHYDNLYVNFRKKFISVKVAGAKIRNKKDSLLLDNIFGDKGYTKAITPQGVIFRIPR
jgi:hypothetical protein